MDRPIISCHQWLFPVFLKCWLFWVRVPVLNQNWSADLQYRRRGAGELPRCWRITTVKENYHGTIGSPVLLCSPAVFVPPPPLAVLSWPSFFSCSRPHTPAAHPSQSTHQRAQLIHPLWDTCIGFLSASQGLLFCLTHSSAVMITYIHRVDV